MENDDGDMTMTIMCFMILSPSAITYLHRFVLLTLKNWVSFILMTSEVLNEEEQIGQIYHERQRKQLCLLHTLNNLFQRREFEQHELDTICECLDDRRWFNPHRSWVGMGNYDANILLVALQTRGLVGRWFDRRMHASRINHTLIKAYIFNIPSTSTFAILPFMKGRHWFPVVRIKDVYFNLDSKLTVPTPMADFIPFIDKHLEAGNELLLVVNPEHEELCVTKEEEKLP